MRFSARALTVALTLLLMALLVPPSLAATRTFCLVGAGNGTGWSWTLQDPASTKTCGDQTVAGVTGTAAAVADRFVGSINGNCSGGTAGPTLGATSARLSSTELARVCGAGFTSGFRVWGGETTGLDLYVANFGTDALTDPSSCGVPDAPGFCNFNPDISAAPPLRGGAQAGNAIPALQPWHYLAIVLLIGVVGAGLMWRRFA